MTDQYEHSCQGLEVWDECIDGKIYSRVASDCDACGGEPAYPCSCWCHKTGFDMQIVKNRWEQESEMESLEMAFASGRYG
jgi:hypothetical protein